MEINISIVDDEKVITDMLVSYLARFEAEPDIKDVHFKINTYSDGLDFLASYPANADIVLMDIDMPRLDGMKTAEKLRAMDEYVTIIFVTNLSQFAVKGYEVGVQDFLVKPVVYPNFAAKIRRALERLENVRDEKIQVSVGDGLKILSRRTIKYIEIMKHDIIYHTTNGDVRTYGSLKQVETILGKGFMRCNSCYLVNLAYVEEVGTTTVTIGSEQLAMSRHRRKEFMRAMADYYGGRI